MTGRPVPYTDPMIPDPREANQPAWVRATLDRLRSQVRSAIVARDEARQEHGPKASDTLLDPYHPAGPINLPKGERVRFIIGETPEGHVDREWIDVQVERQTYRDGKTAIWLHLMGGDGISVSPQSSNVIRVTIDPS